MPSKEKKEGLWSMSFGQIIETFKVLEVHGVTPQHFAEMRRNKERGAEVANLILESSLTIENPRTRRSYAKPPTERAFTVFVDYAALELKVEDGRYDEVRSEDFTRKDFPIRRRTHVLITIELVPVEETVDFDEFTAGLESKGYRHANVYELTSLGAHHPKLQLSFWIWGFGSFERNSIAVQEGEIRRALRRHSPVEVKKPLEPRRHNCYLEGYFRGVTPHRILGIDGNVKRSILARDNVMVAVVKIPT